MPYKLEGVPTRIQRVRQVKRRLRGAGNGMKRGKHALEAQVEMAANGINFTVWCASAMLCVIEGLELQSFGSLALEQRHVEHVPYAVTPLFAVDGKVSLLAPQLRIIAVSTATEQDAAELAKLVSPATDVQTWSPGQCLENIPLRSVAIITRNTTALGPGSAEVVGVEALLPIIGASLPYLGRVWLVILGAGGHVWSSAGRQWAAKYPGLQISSLHTDVISTIVPACLLDTNAPACLTVVNEEVRSLQVTSQHEQKAEDLYVAGVAVEPHESIAVLSHMSTPFTAEIVRKLRAKGADVVPTLTGEKITTGAVQITIL